MSLDLGKKERMGNLQTRKEKRNILKNSINLRKFTHNGMNTISVRKQDKK